MWYIRQGTVYIYLSLYPGCYEVFFFFLFISTFGVPCPPTTVAFASVCLPASTIRLYSIYTCSIHGYICAESSPVSREVHDPGSSQGRPSPMCETQSGPWGSRMAGKNKYLCIPLFLFLFLFLFFIIQPQSIYIYILDIDLKTMDVYCTIILKCLYTRLSRLGGM